MSNSVGHMDIISIFGNNPPLDTMSQDSGALDIFFSFSEFPTDRDDNDSIDAETKNEFSLTTKPKLDSRALVTLNETLGSSMPCKSVYTDPRQACEEDQGQQQSFGQADSLGCISPLFGMTSCSHDLIGSHLNRALPSVPSPISEEMLPSSRSGLVSPGDTVYSSIAVSPLQGRAIDFRSFLTKKQVPPSVLKESPAGVFVGQLPSTYSEEDTAALLRAIGADAGVTVHVRDVKSHNQSRTCAFVVVNSSALPVLLGYSKRILCDVSCVWVVERNQAAHLKDYINGFLRERLRGVPKAALVLEELTPQYMRSRSFSCKGVKNGGRNPANLCMGQDNIFLASAIQDGVPVLGSQTLPMGLFPPGWNPVGPQSMRFRTMAGGSGGPQFVNGTPGSNAYGVPQANVFTALASPPMAPPTPQVNFYVVAAAPPGLPPNNIYSVPQGRANNETGHTALSANGNTGISLSPAASDSHCRCGDVPLFPHLYERKPCSICLSPISALEAVYVCPHDHTVTCIRCRNMRNTVGDTAHVIGGVAPCIVPQPGFGGFPHPSHGSSVFVHALPPYPSHYGSQPSLTPQVPPQQ